MSAVVRRHGGIVEKYIGDAIMAVFGVPTLHEDDALRAVRAAVEMRDTLAALNRELEAGWGVRLANRIGVNTGEVIAGDHRRGHLFVTGEAVNVAKRLEEAAAADEILIGSATHSSCATRSSSSRAGRVTLKHGRDDRTPSSCWTSSPTPPALRAASTRLSSGASASAPCSATVFDNAVRDADLPPGDRARRRGRRASRGCVREFTAELAGECDGPARPLPALRRGHHLLAAGRDRPGDRARRGPDPASSPRRRSRRSPGVAAGREGRADRRARGRGARARRRGRRDQRGDLLGRPQAVRGARASGSARRRGGRPPLGRADVPRPDRARRRLLARFPDPARLHRPAGAARHAPWLGRRASATRRRSSSSRSATRNAAS